MNFKQLDWQNLKALLARPFRESKAPWNANKSAKLEAFIKGWGRKDLVNLITKKELLVEMSVADNLYAFGDGPVKKCEYSDNGLGTAKVSHRRAL